MTEAKREFPIWSSKTIMLFLGIALGIVVIGIALYFAALRLEAASYMPIIQQALDEQCGEGNFVADLDGFSGDPLPSWGSSEATCNFDHSTDKFICSCEGVP